LRFLKDWLTRIESVAGIKRTQAATARSSSHVPMIEEGDRLGRRTRSELQPQRDLRKSRIVGLSRLLAETRVPESITRQACVPRRVEQVDDLDTQYRGGSSACVEFDSGIEQLHNIIA
jgi:hypothetical protein